MSWDAISNSSDVYTILVYYITPDGDKHIIDCSLRQHNFIDWTIPSTISNFKQPNIVFYDDNKIIKKEPKVVVIPESTGYVNSECFGVIDPGEFNQDGYCQVSCEYIDSSANINIYDGYIAEFSKDDGLKQIYYYKDLPEVHFDITNTKRLKYKKGDFGVEITVGIAYPQDTRIKSEIHNILII